MPDPTKAVFMSYASQDAEAARRICESLRSLGIEVWFDQSELRGGDSWDHQIRKQILECELFIPVISESTQRREEGYFRLEWHLADQRKLLMTKSRPFLIPVCIDDTSESNAEVPDSFKAVQWTRLPKGITAPALGKRVLDLLSRRTSPDSATVVAPVPARPGENRIFARKNSRLPVVLAAISGVIFVGWFALDKFHSSKLAAAPGGQIAVSADAPAHSSNGPAEKSIAVLPFVDMSEKHDQEYFADGLTDELIDHLARSADLKVIARTSSFAFKGKSEDVRSIALKLGVANLLEGSVRKSGMTLRISAQLIRALDGTHVWSQTYNRKLKDIFDLQDDMAETVARALNAALVVRNDTDARNPEAYNLVLEGDYFDLRGQAGDAEKSMQLFRQATNIEPTYALAWAKVANGYEWLGFTGAMPSAEAADRAREAVQHSLALDPNLAYAHLVLGSIHQDLDWNWTSARAEFVKAAALDPTGITRARDALGYLSWILTGDIEDNIIVRRERLARDPLNINALANLGVAYWGAGRWPDALVSYRRLLDLNPTFDGGWALYGDTLLLMGRFPEALSALEKETDERRKLELLPCVYWRLNRKSDSDAALDQIKTKYGTMNAYDVAAAFACRGEIDSAFEWLEKAIDTHQVGPPNMKFDPSLINMRSDRRFKALLRRVNLPE